MAWVTVPGLAGIVYVPDGTGQIKKKHPCKACFSCQWCDENRCQVCRGEQANTCACASMNCCGKKGRQTPANRSYPFDRK